MPYSKGKRITAPGDVLSLVLQGSTTLKSLLPLRCPKKLWDKLFPLSRWHRRSCRSCWIRYSHSAAFSWRAHISFRGTGKEDKRWVRDVYTGDTSQRTFPGHPSSFFKCLPILRPLCTCTCCGRFQTVAKISKCREGFRNPKSAFLNVSQQHGGPSKNKSFIKGIISAPLSSSTDLGSWQIP